MPRIFVGLVAAAPLLVASSSAWAGPCASECAFLPNLTSATECQFVTTGGCTAQCTPLSVVAECSGECTGGFQASCTGGCEGSCMAKCTANPGSFQCTGDCQTTCEGSCMSGCNGDGACETDCQGYCGNQCDVQCQATPPSADCTARCQASCQGSCTVENDLQCHAQCSVKAQGGCKVACTAPSGALFCNGDYVDAQNAAACISCLEVNGLSASGTCNLAGCKGGIGCETSPAVGSSEDRWGVFGITGLMVGLGLVVSRRSRRGTQ